MTVSDVAVHFFWTSCRDAREYQIHCDRSPEFAGGFCEVAWNVIEQLNIQQPDCYAHLPDRTLEPGRWFWRVRAVVAGGLFGPWSETRSFTVTPIGPEKPLAIEVSAGHPLFVLYSSRVVAPNWASIDEELKPFCALRIEETPGKMAELCAEAQEHGVPVIAQLAGPHDSRDGIYWRIPLSEVEHLFQRYPMVRGVTVVEQSCQGGLASRIVVAYLKRLLALAASYGRLVIWADGHWYGNNLWTEVLNDEELYSTLGRYAPYIVPTWKMNCAWTPYLIQSSIFGLWLGGACDRWGVEMESWYWNEAGFTSIGKQGGFKDGEIRDCPPVFYAVMATLGLTAGATVYVCEPDSDVWEKPGRTSRTWREVMQPLFSRTVEWGLIPSAPSVRKNVKVAYRVQEADARWLPEYGGWLPIYDRTYGRRHPFQMIPGQGRYYWIPALSRHGPPSLTAGFQSVVEASFFADPDKAAAHLDRLYPADGSRNPPGRSRPRASGSGPAAGSAWQVKVGDLCAVINSHENRDEEEDYAFDLRGAFTRVSGTCAVNGVLLLKQADDGTLHLLTLGRTDRQITVAIETASGDRPVHRICEPAALASEAWDPAAKTLTLTIAHAHGAVSIVSEMKGLKG